MVHSFIYKRLGVIQTCQLSEIIDRAMPFFMGMALFTMKSILPYFSILFGNTFANALCATGHDGNFIFVNHIFHLFF